MVEAIRYAAYGIFLLGAARSFRDNGSGLSLAVMALAIVVSAAAGLPTLLGNIFPGADQTASSILLASALRIELFAVWLLFPLAVIARRTGRTAFFHRAIVGVEAGWFFALMIMFYARYNPHLYLS